MTIHRGLLVSAGYFSQFHAEAWARMPDVDITAVVDPLTDKARAFADRFGIAGVYGSLEEALDRERPDFVDIATRPESHVELTRVAASRGVHVICQKPMAPTLAECMQMCDACDAGGVRLLIHENWRWQPWYREIRRLLDTDIVGRPFQFSFFWRTGDGRGENPYPTQPYFSQMPRLLIYETLVHVLDTYRYLGGDLQVRHCTTARVNPAIIGEDQAVIHAEFDSGATGLIDGNRITGPAPAPVAMGTLTVEGDEGVLRMAPDGMLYLRRADSQEEPLPFVPPEVGYKGDSVFATQRHLIDCLAGGIPAQSEGRDYLKTVALVEACYASAQEPG